MTVATKLPEPADRLHPHRPDRPAIVLAVMRYDRDDRRRFTAMVLCPWCGHHHAVVQRIDEPRPHPCRRNLGVTFSLTVPPHPMTSGDGGRLEAVHDS